MYQGDYKKGSIIDLKFCTVDSSGAPTALTSGEVVVYKDNGTTEDTDNETATLSFDSVTGLNHVRIDTSADPTFYARRADYFVVISVGTVAGVSAVGYVVAHFSIENRYVPGLLARGVVVSATAGGAVLAPFAFADNLTRGSELRIVGGTGAGQSRFAVANDESDDSVALSPDWDTNPDTTSEYEWIQGPPSVSSPLPEVDANVAYRKNVAQTFTFWLVDANNNPVTGITPVGTISQDGGAFAAFTNAITEIDAPSGAYIATWTAAEWNCDEFLFEITGTGAQTLRGKVRTQP